MKSIGETSKKYFEELARRSKISRVYQPHQFAGLTIAMLLRDLRHKALYMKLAKEYDADYLLELAKSVVEKKNVKNCGAYFMKILSSKRR